MFNRVSKIGKGGYFSPRPLMSSSRITISSSPSILTVWLACVAEDHPVTGFRCSLDELNRSLNFASTDGEDFAHVRLLGCVARQNDAGAVFFSFETLNNNAVVQGQIFIRIS